MNPVPPRPPRENGSHLARTLAARGYHVRAFQRDAARTPDVPDIDVAVRRPTLEDVFLELTGRALRD